jgi:hypothetical protein
MANFIKERKEQGVLLQRKNTQPKTKGQGNTRSKTIKEAA